MTTQADLFTRMASFGFDDGATFSPDRRYRYHLWRSWGSREHRCVFVGVNPSVANETLDDPTVRKCIGFAKRWGFAAIDIVNLFALVSTNPTGLLHTSDPIGLENDETLKRVFGSAHRIVWAWGSHNAAINKLIAQRTREWVAVPRLRYIEVGCLGRTQDGSPRHPSRIGYATRFEVMP